MVSQFMDRNVITVVVIDGGEHGSSDWSKCFLAMLLLLCRRFFNCSLARSSVLETFGLAVTLPLAEVTSLITTLNRFFDIWLLFLSFSWLFGGSLVCNESINDWRSGK